MLNFSTEKTTYILNYVPIFFYSEVSQCFESNLCATVLYRKMLKHLNICRLLYLSVSEVSYFSIFFYCFEILCVHISIALTTTSRDD